jgi:hypothetical protein
MKDITQQDSNDEWQGFRFPTTGFTRIPNDFIDILSHINNMAELKVILYVMRHTWGFQEYDEFKRISMDDFAQGRKLSPTERMDKGTGLSEMAARNGVAKAIEHGFLECKTDYTDMARIQKSYRLKMRPDILPESEATDKPQSGKERLYELQTMPYPDYLKTEEWAKKRAKALRFAQYHCQLCNTSESLTVHHRTYERRGHENMGDLIVLCKDCHDTFTYNRNLAK